MRVLARVWHRVRVIIFRVVATLAGAIILPFQPSFAAILAVGVIPPIAYPYWRDVRMFPSWWAGVSRGLVVGLRRACDTRASWGARRQPRAWLARLESLCSAVWLYLGLVAALVLPHHPGSWGRIGGTAAILVGAGFGVAAWLERERDVPATVDQAATRQV